MVYRMALFIVECGKMVEIMGCRLQTMEKGWGIRAYCSSRKNCARWQIKPRLFALDQVLRRGDQAARKPLSPAMLEARIRLLI
jgi:hypothetical protein